MPRFQIQDLPPEQGIQHLQVNADTYTGAPQPVLDQNAERLASALGQFSATIKTLVRKEDNNISPTIRFLQDNPDPVSRVAAVGTGAYPMVGNKEADTWAMSKVGTDAAHMAMRDWEANLKTGLYNPTNPDGSPKDPWQDYQEKVNAKAQYLRDKFPLLQNNEAFNKALYDTTNGLRTQFDTKLAEYNANGRKVAQEQAIGNLGSAVLDTANRTDVTDEQIKTSLQTAKDRFYNAFKAANGNEGMDYKAMDRQMFDYFKSQASQHPDAVDRILRMDRGTTKEGIRLGAIYERLLPVETQQIQETIRSARERNFDIAREREAIDAARGSLMKGDGSFLSTQDHTYTNPFAINQQLPKVVQADSARSKAIAEFQTNRVQEFMRQGRSPQDAAMEVAKSDIPLYTSNNIPNPQWKAGFDYAATVLGNPAQASVPENMQRLVAARKQYEELSNINPGYVRDKLGVNDTTSKMFELAKVFRDSGASPTEEDAINRAIKAVTNPAKVELNKEAKTALEKGINQVWYGTNSWFTNKIDPENTKDPVIRKQHHDLAMALATEGQMAPEKAVNAAADILSRRIVNINGKPYVNDPFVTRDTAPGWERLLQDTFKNKSSDMFFNGDNKISSWKDLNIQREGQGGLYKVYTKEGFPVMERVQSPSGSWGWEPVRLTSAQMKQTQGLLNAERDGKIAAEQNVTVYESSKAAGNFNKLTPAQQQLETQRYEASKLRLQELNDRASGRNAIDRFIGGVDPTTRPWAKDLTKPIPGPDPIGNN